MPLLQYTHHQNASWSNTICPLGDQDRPPGSACGGQIGLPDPLGLFSALTEFTAARGLRLPIQTTDAQTSTPTLSLLPQALCDSLLARSDRMDGGNCGLTPPHDALVEAVNEDDILSVLSLLRTLTLHQIDSPRECATSDWVSETDLTWYRLQYWLQRLAIGCPRRDADSHSHHLPLAAQGCSLQARTSRRHWTCCWLREWDL